MASATSSTPQDPIAVARERIDDLHRQDPLYNHDTSPSTDSADEESRAQNELEYADSMERWTVKLVELHQADASSSGQPLPDIFGNVPLLRLAARCQHLERFKTPRSSFPEGKAGYLQWRRSLYSKQADKAKEVLVESGVSSQDADMVHKWVRKGELNLGKDTGDAGTQLLEDAAVMVFLEKEMAAFAQKQQYPDEKLVDILRKTLRKISPIGTAAATQLPMPTAFRKLLETAIQARPEGTSIPKGIERAHSVNASKPLQRPKTFQEAQTYLSERSQHEDASAEAPFGSRILLNDDEDAIWEHNAWDHVEPPSDYLEEIEARLAAQSEHKVPDGDADRFHEQPASFWDTFYAAHKQGFFKNRKWLSAEFPELEAALEPDAGPKVLVEIGCGAGDTLLPLWQDSRNPHLRLLGFDYSAEAVRVIHENPLYMEQHPGSCTAAVWDLSMQDQVSMEEPCLPPEVEAGTVDVVVLIFVLSALHPREWAAAARNVHAMLKPGGKVLFRDYGRYDMPQLRFKKNRMLEDNFYVRGDGTRVYFFESDEIVSIFHATAPVEEAEDIKAQEEQQEFDRHGTKFQTLQMVHDRRMLVNRRQKKRMYRVWLQAKFAKL